MSYCVYCLVPLLLGEDSSFLVILKLYNTFCNILNMSPLYGHYSYLWKGQGFFYQIVVDNL